MTEISVASAGLRQIPDDYAELTHRLAHTSDLDDFMHIAREVDPSIPDNLNRLAVMFRVVRVTGLLEDDVKRAITLLTELRLVAPSDIADSAQRVIYTAFAQEITSALSTEKRHVATDAFNGAINDFVNRVRRHMHVEDHEFEVMDRSALDNLLG